MLPALSYALLAALASHYSPLDQINRKNVSRLRPAWTYHTGDSRDRPQTTIECTPIVMDGVMYITTAQLKAVALEAATGKKLWEFDPPEEKSRGVNRGVAYWSEGEERRVLYVVGPRLICLNARTGRSVPGFGSEGFVNLRQGLDRDITGLTYTVSSPGSIYQNLIILGSTMGEGPRPSAPGHIRAFDVRTGKQVWMFRTIPHPGEVGHETWEGDSWKTAGAANNWGGMSVDEERGLVFASTGSPAFDFYGGQRLGDNVFGNSVIALEAATGKRVWHFQTIHHDVWDYDLPCPPALVTITRGGRKIDAVAQVTKTGMVHVFERETGKPVFEIEERLVPASDIPGERLARTQPFPVKPPPFSPQRFEPTNISPEARAAVLEQLKKLRAGNIYEPPSRQGTVVVPGYHGGALWGGAAFDPASGWLYVAANSSANILTIVPARPGAAYPFDFEGYIWFRDPEGYPAVKPPWGTLNAIDLNRGEIAWQVPVGEFPELKARGVPQTGTELVGGAIVTAGGLVFLGASKDEKFRAFDSKTGKILWETQLEAGAYATPATYEVNGKQYVIVAAGGGGKQRTRAGDAFVAFALP
jgi:quinoprotein glucose dehydrogenase